MDKAIVPCPYAGLHLQEAPSRSTDPKHIILSPWVSTTLSDLKYTHTHTHTHTPMYLSAALGHSRLVRALLLGLTALRCAGSRAWRLGSRVWELSFPTRDRTRVSHIARQTLHHWTITEVPECMLSPFGCVRLFATPWTVAHQAPLSMGILQARILEWVAISFSKGSSWPRDRTHPLFRLLQGQVGSLPLAPPGKPPHDFQWRD